MVTKYSASGNDFVILVAQNIENRTDLAKKLCDRHNGVGADGLVVVVPHTIYDFEWDFYNSDGSSASMCGNASRAVAHYAVDRGISRDGVSEFLTKAGVIRASVNGDYVISDMVKPKFLDKEIVEDGVSWWLLDTGVPHLVSIVEDIEFFDIQKMRELRYKYNANVNIVKINSNFLEVRTYERGVEDETLACGTGMVACFVRAFTSNLIPSSMKVFPKSREELYISYENDTYRFGGKVIKVFNAELFI